MLKKVINYTDFNGEQQTETHYFHMNRPEAVRFEAKYGGDLSVYAKSLANASVKENFEFIEDIILSAYGERTADGRGFNKSPEIVANFKNSLAYDALFEEMVTVEGAAEQFGMGIVAQPGGQQVKPELKPLPSPKVEEQQPGVYKNIQDASAADLLERMKNDPVLRAQLLGE